MSITDIRHFHLFCGLGGGAAGFNRGQARVGQAEAAFRCIGGVDSDPASVADFTAAAGVPGTALDLFDAEQYEAWHGQPPPDDWRPAGPDDIRRAAHGERPHIVFTSPPCKGFSGLLSQARSTGPRYHALNALTLRGIWLTLEAWADDPPEMMLLENVPRIANRGRPLLDQIIALLERYGYATAETVHDCGELGGLGQSRRRFLLVARHREKVPPFLYEPTRRPLRSVGEILGPFPLPGDVDTAGPMHRLPRLQWRTWVRLALVEAGSDWRSLQRLRVEDGVLADLGIVPEREYHQGAYGVTSWADSGATVTSRAGPSNGRYSVADPRREAGSSEYRQYGVKRWEEVAATVTGHRSPGQGPFSIADPRHHGPAKHSNEYRVIRWDGAGQAVTGAHGSGQCIADPRCGMAPDRAHYRTGGHYGVAPWTQPAGVIAGHAKHDRGPFSVADPRVCADWQTEHSCLTGLPAATDRGVYRISSLDGTWHRPFTTLELAALQGLVQADEYLHLHGSSDSAWRERIGNAVPPPAAQAIASVMGTTLLLAWAGETFLLSNQPIWVQPLAAALATQSTVLPDWSGAIPQSSPQRPGRSGT